MGANPLLVQTIEGILRQEAGLNIASLGKNSIKKALTRRMRTLSIEHVPAYISLIKKSKKELHTFIDEIAINETWFYRDEAPFNTLSIYALSCLKNYPEQPLHLLSVPCSTGEEPYSMAISLLEAGLTDDQYTIDAIDISTRSLTQARNGIYTKNSFRGQSTRFQKRYFEESGRGGYRIKERVRKNISFYKGNLFNLSLPLIPRSYNCIFCRNLFIYLDTNFHGQVIDTLANLLRDDGLLFIGHSESGLFTDSPFQPAPFPKAFSYFKKNQSRMCHSLNESGYFNDTIHNLPLQEQTKNGANSGTKATHQPNNEDLTIKNAQNHHKNNQPAEAIQIYERIIQKKGPSAQIFYHMGAIFYETHDIDNSIKILKKAIYLDPDLIEAINLLSSIYEELGDQQNFLACIKRSKRVQNRLNRED